MRILSVILLSCISLSAALDDRNVFTWPAGTSNCGPYAVVPTITSTIVFSPTSDACQENVLSGHKYQHHTRISWFQGTTFLAFSSGPTNEDSSGQQTWVTTSLDRGTNWSNPAQVAPSQTIWSDIKDDGTRITEPRNFTVYGGTNYLTCACDERKSGGNLWARALLCRSVALDGTVGDLFRISAVDYPPSNGVAAVDYDATLGPPLMVDSKLYGCWGGSYGAPAQEWNGWLITNTSWTFVEPNTVSVDGGTNNFYRLWRGVGPAGEVNTTTNIYQQFSSDGGISWTFPTNTTIPNQPSETAVIRLTTGQFAIVGNPLNYTDSSTYYRDPLFLALTAPDSTVITNVWAIRQGVSKTPTYAGTGKVGGAAYPHVCQVGNYLYVSYSLQKESIGFSRVLIPGLPDNNNDALPALAHVTAGSGTFGKATFGQ